MRSDTVEDESLLVPSRKECRLWEQEETESLNSYPSWQEKSNGFITRAWKTMFLYMALFMIYCGSLIFVYRIAPKCSVERLAYSPIELGTVATVYVHKHSKYVGKPNPGLDDAWRELLLNFNIRITEEELSHTAMAKEDAISLPDGGYYAGLSVYHDLHCIKRLHHYMYPDYYFANLTEEQRELNEYHTHHCLDMLRQSVMCHGDTQLITMQWLKSATTPTGTFKMPHKCADWTQLENWASSRRIERLMEPGYLFHPTLGPAYPGGHADVVGEIKVTAEDEEDD
ncbi:hypothetical protein NLG97_g7284 [Lecanicillium saksenae]|uniref:Uncharacterized protein n=1 Tax=Lecanicillium saksenae TaxID=468837 RepID=A0ACC1QQ87_9HYPO|nr:hypothetical protein NLG97_g7284 [Lecanicillium saksenae]